MHPSYQPHALTRFARIYQARHFRDGASKVDQLALFQEAGWFNYRGFPIPDVSRTTVANRGQVEDELSVRPGSFLTTISSVSDQAAGFKFNVWDKATGEPLFAEWVRDTAAGSRPIASLGNRRLPNYLPAPWAVPEPGTLTVRIINLASAANSLQLYLVFAEPVGGGSVRGRVRS